MSFNILIASHFHLNLRYELFKETVKSLANQPIKKILLSYSKEKNIQTNVEELFKENFKNYFINYSDNQLTQFEHFEILSKSKEIDSEWIVFCDDDDMYHPKRLEIIEKEIKRYPEFLVFTDMMTIIHVDVMYSQIFEQKEYNYTLYSDFANIIIKSDLFIDWFDSEGYLNYKKLNPKRPVHCDDLFFKACFTSFTKKINQRLYFRRMAPFTENYRYWHA